MFIWHLQRTSDKILGNWSATSAGKWGRKTTARGLHLAKGIAFCSELKHFRNKHVKMRTKTLGKLKLDLSSAVWPWWAHAAERFHEQEQETVNDKCRKEQSEILSKGINVMFTSTVSTQCPALCTCRWLPSKFYSRFPLSLPEQGRKGGILFIYLFIFLFDLLDVNPFLLDIPPGFQWVGGCVGAEAPKRLHTTTLCLLPGTEKWFPSIGFPYCSSGRNRAGHALWAWSYLKPLP